MKNSTISNEAEFKKAAKEVHSGIRTEKIRVKDLLIGTVMANGTVVLHDGKGTVKDISMTDDAKLEAEKTNCILWNLGEPYVLTDKAFAELKNLFWIKLSGLRKTSQEDYLFEHSYITRVIGKTVERCRDLSITAILFEDICLGVLSDSYRFIEASEAVKTVKAGLEKETTLTFDSADVSPKKIIVRYMLPEMSDMINAGFTKTLPVIREYYEDVTPARDPHKRGRKKKAVRQYHESVVAGKRAPITLSAGIEIICGNEGATSLSVQGFVLVNGNRVDVQESKFVHRGVPFHYDRMMTVFMDTAMAVEKIKSDIFPAIIAYGKNLDSVKNELIKGENHTEICTKVESYLRYYAKTAHLSKSAGLRIRNQLIGTAAEKLTADRNEVETIELVMKAIEWSSEIEKMKLNKERVAGVRKGLAYLFTVAA